MKTKELLKVEYNPDRIVQHYYKQISEVRLLLTALGETVTDEDVKRNAYATFKNVLTSRKHVETGIDQRQQPGTK